MPTIGSSLCFDSPTPEGAEYVGRNHRFVAALARFLLEEALEKRGNATASRCGALRTQAVRELTTIFLLRVRYLIEQPQARPLLAEEVLVLGARETNQGGISWLDEGEPLRLLAKAKPDANMPLPEKRALVQGALEAWPALTDDVKAQVNRRAEALEASHKRVRQAVSLRVRELKVNPQLPPDLLGILVLQPMVQP